MYGLTECKRVTYLPPEQLDIRPTSVGRGMPNEEVWLVDESRSAAAQRQHRRARRARHQRDARLLGEARTRPRSASSRARSRAKCCYTRATFSAPTTRASCTSSARKDDIIKSRGEKVSPREVENAIYSLEGVLDAAVVGVPDPVLGEAIKAFVVLKDGHALTERDVIRHCLQRLESFMAPKHVEFVRELPTTDTGKIKKTALG